jgi:hypothetical protein
MQKTPNRLSKNTAYAVRPTLFILVPFLLLFAIEVPLEFHGTGYLGKYLNSDTTRYNMDASIDVYCTVLKHSSLAFFLRYRDDLDMAEQRGGVSLDPRFAHYYIVSGFNYTTAPFFFALYFMHDCIHDIDYEVEGTPIFNRFRIQVADADYHYSKRLITTKRFLWSFELGVYPHWNYHSWDINDGADYQYDMILRTVFHVFRKGNVGISLMPKFHLTSGDTCFYHQHSVMAKTYYRNNGKQIGLGFNYNMWNNDIIKNPDRLWLLLIFVDF